jgi:hypothetical protein
MGLRAIAVMETKPVSCLYLLTDRLINSSGAHKTDSDQFSQHGDCGQVLPGYHIVQHDACFAHSSFTCGQT